MDPEPPSGPGRVSLVRGLIAFVVFLFLLVLTLGYHDGAFGTQPVTATDLVEGSYRFKGTVESWDESNQTFRLRDASGVRDFAWNITTPKVGAVYVVDADVGVQGPWQALALTRPVLIEGSW